MVGLGLSKVREGRLGSVKLGRAPRIRVEDPDAFLGVGV
jgi:hypothetical protein